MKPPTGTPCGACPFRRVALPGWLGDDTPEGFIRTVHADHEMPCHKTVDYEARDWKENLHEARFCSGALIHAANSCLLSRDRTRPTLPKDKETVFATLHEFIAHHKQDLSAWNKKMQADGHKPEKKSPRRKKAKK